MANHPIVKVAVPVPLYRTFDYLVSDSPAEGLQAGARLRVPFGRSSAVGISLGTQTNSELPLNKLKPVLECLDGEPILDTKLLELLHWAADYYMHPIGEVFQTGLPVLLRRGHPAEAEIEVYGLRIPLEDAFARVPTRAKKQRAMLRWIAEHPESTLEQLAQRFTNVRATLNLLESKQLVQRGLRPAHGGPRQSQVISPPLRLNPHQQTAVDNITGQLNKFQTHLLFGVTGSGKTEVYLHCLERVLEKKRQALVLVPEISLTPQLIGRFEQRFSGGVCVLHSGLSDTQRLDAWRRARSGDAAIVLGTRSAVFTPLARPGLIIVDEEHDSSLKQQEGFRYSARDIAVYRARQHAIPAVLGSATPSLESLFNGDRERYRVSRLPERAGNAKMPHFTVVDLHHHPADSGLSAPLVTAMGHHLNAGGQVLLFLNRRGYAPVLFCTNCGWIASCSRCDANMTVHLLEHKIRCHHCGHENLKIETCPQCTHELKPVGQGTQRIEANLAELFPDYAVMRIDRDSTRKKNAMEDKLKTVTSGKTKILVGTQMLTKGHDFPDVTLVGVLNGDQGLFGTDFRANEKFAQTVIQVAGRAGRGSKAGEVYIQTHFPGHPLLTKLCESGYEAFAQAALRERQLAHWPPFSAIALLRVSAPQKPPVYEFLAQARNQANRPAKVNLMGPAPAPMERRAGRYRGQLLIQAESRQILHRFLKPWVLGLENLKSARKVRWSVDVDPVELF